MMRVVILLILLGVQQNLLARFSEGIVPFKDGNKWGWADVHTGNVVIEPVYDSVKYDFYKDVFLIYKDSKVGVISYEADRNDNKVWKVIIEPVYDEIYRLKRGLYITVLNNQKGAFLENYGNILSQAHHDFDYCFGYIDNNQYKYSNGNFQFLLMQNKEYKGGVFDIKSKKIINSLRYNVYRYEEGFWKDSFKSQARILLNHYIFKDENGKFFYLSNFLEFKEVKEGVDFNDEKLTLSFWDFPSFQREFYQPGSWSFNYNISNFGRNDEKEYHIEKWRRYKLISSDWNGNPVASNRKATKFGILNKQTKKFLIEPNYDKLSMEYPSEFLKLTSDIVIGHKGNKYTIFINYVKIIEGVDKLHASNIDRFSSFNQKLDNFYIIYKKDNLYGFVIINYVKHKTRIYDNEVEKLEWKLFEPKYKSLEISQTYSSGWSYDKMHVFKATDINGETFFVNENGFEFRR